MRRRGAHLLGGATLALARLAALPTLVHRRCLTWGARPDEAERRLPGDDLLPEPDVVSTRVVTVQAPPKVVWPWLVQLSSGGGVGTCDWFESLVGLDLHSAEEIRPELQRLKVGDVVPMGVGGPGRAHVVEPGRALAVRSADATRVWILALYPDGPGTRLVSRNRIAGTRSSPARRLINALVTEPSDLLTERATLRGIKQRAERVAKRERARRRPAGGSTNLHEDRVL